MVQFFTYMKLYIFLHIRNCICETVCTYVLFQITFHSGYYETLDTVSCAISECLAFTCSLYSGLNLLISYSASTPSPLPFCRRPGADPWVGKIPWRRRWQPTAVLLPGESHGQKGLAGYSHGVTKIQTRLSDFTPLSPLVTISFFPMSVNLFLFELYFIFN